MKQAFRILVPAFLVLICAGILFTGCKKKETNPVSPAPVATNTPIPPTNTLTRTVTSTVTLTLVPTGTFTMTETNTPVPTDTNTPVATNTNTPVATDTNTPVATDTNTPVATNTNTTVPTDTNTPAATDTFTVSPTATCAAAYADHYGFDSDLECWYTENTQTGTTVDWTNTAPSGVVGGALHAYVSYGNVLAYGNYPENFSIQLPSTVDLTGKIIRARIYVPNATKGTAWGGGIQVNAGTGSDGSGWCGTWENIQGFDGWYTYLYNMSSCGNPGVVKRLGVQIALAPGSVPGDVYIDSFDIIDAPTPTFTATPTITNTPFAGDTYTPTVTMTVTLSPTPAPTLGSYTFDATVEGWTNAENLGTLSVSNTVYDAGGGSLTGTATYAAAWEGASFMVDISPFASILNKLVTVKIRVDAGLEGGYAQFNFQDSAWTNNTHAWTQIVNEDQWYTLSWIGSPCDTGASVETIQRVTVQYLSAGAGTGSVYIDSFTVSDLPAAVGPNNYFEAGMEGWADVGGASELVCALSWVQPGYAGSLGEFGVQIPFTAAGQKGAVGVNFGTPITMTVGSSIRMSIYVPAVIGSNPGAQIFVKSGAGWTMEYPGWIGLNSGCWSTVSYTPPFTASGTDPDMVRQIGVQILTGGSTGSTGTSDCRIDNVEIY